jgi:hypothetical protein
MPQFKTHIGFGLILAVGSVAIIATYSIASSNYLFAMVFIAVIFGTALPDLDSDKGTPFKIAISILAAIMGAGVFSRISLANNGNIFPLILYPIFAYFFTRFVGGYVLSKLTHHRGIIHSIPSAALSFFLAKFLLNDFPLDSYEKFLVALALFFGYFGHLILDELSSLVDWKGILPKTDQSLGSALKLWSRSTLASTVIYVALFYFVYSNLSTLEANFHQLFN